MTKDICLIMTVIIMIRNSWKPFEVQEIFDNIQRGIRLTKDNQIEGNIPYISSTSLNNGVDNFIGNKENVRTSGYDLTIANSGSVGSTFYHPYNYIASDHVHSLSNEKFNKYQYLFLSVLLNRLKDKYHFNREINEKRLKTDKLMLPVNDEGSPDWEYMEQQGKRVYERKQNDIFEYLKKKQLELKTQLSKINEPIIEEITWKTFEVEDIVYIKSGVRLTKKNQKIGNTPFIGATEYNNGVTALVSNINDSLDSNVVGVNYNGAVVESFYHPYKAIFSDDVKRIELKDTSSQNKYVYLFLITMIKMQKKKYMYSYKFNAKRMSKQKILLPVNSTGNPDWNFMEYYMKQIEYKQISKLIEYLN